MRYRLSLRQTVQVRTVVGARPFRRFSSKTAWLLAAGGRGATLVLLASACTRPAGGWHEMGVDQDRTLIGVSCASPRFCNAIDLNGYAVLYQQGTWTSPIAVDTANAANGGQPASISCPSVTFCVLVDHAGAAMTFNGRTWSAPYLIDKGGALVSISCPTPDFCLAADDSGEVFTYRGGTWSRPQSVDGVGSFAWISCSAQTACVAVTSDSDNSTYRYQSGAWRHGASLATSTPQGGSEPNVLSHVSCPSSSFCAALDTFGEVFTYNGSKWSDPKMFDKITNERDAVSCAASSFCLIVDDAGNFTRYDGQWSQTAPIEAGRAVDAQSVSCPTRSFCMAVGGAGQAFIYGTS